jgi:hypothetical protein
MKDDRDMVLQGLFADANQELTDEDFTPRVMAKTHSLRNRLLAAGAGLMLTLAIMTWVFNLPLFDLTQQVSQVFTFALFDLGEGWLAWVLAPLNNIAGLLLLCVKAVRVIRKKLIGLL